jgi:hypothetical protein
MSNEFDLQPEIKEPEVSEERKKKYIELSGFLGFVECSNQYDNPIPSRFELINRYLDQEEAYAKHWKEMADYDNECYRSNQRLLKAIKRIKGRVFYKHLLQLIKDCDRVYEKMCIVKEPGGEWQKETDYGRSITGVWVDQWSTGTEGDSFDGYVWVQLKPNKYLQFRYSM